MHKYSKKVPQPEYGALSGAFQITNSGGMVVATIMDINYETKCEKMKPFHLPPLPPFFNVGDTARVWQVLSCQLPILQNLIRGEGDVVLRLICLKIFCPSMIVHQGYQYKNKNFTHSSEICTLNIPTKQKVCTLYIRNKYTKIK